MYIVFKFDMFGNKVPLFVSQDPISSCKVLFSGRESRTRMHFKGNPKMLLHI